jgi:DNA-binding response OmpR family regulator
MTKPFEADELTVRIEALLRRRSFQGGARVHLVGNLRVDVPRQEVKKDGKVIYLSAQEFHLLHYLMDRRGHTVSRAELLRAVWGYDTSTYSRTVDVHVFSLRQKLEEDPGRPSLITTVSGVGYKLNA